MASHFTRSTSSPRDANVDADSSLARKKQRLSDEDQGELTDDSVLVEALEPDDIGTNIENAIEIEDDHSMDLPPYSEDFQIFRDLSEPLDQLSRLGQIVAGNQYLDTKIFVAFARSLDRHVHNTANQSSEWRQRYLEDEPDFFGKLALVAVHILDTGDLFEPNVDCNDQGVRSAFEGLLSALVTLSERIIPLLPGAIKATFSRRDSGQAPARQRALPALYYLSVAQRLIMPDTPFLCMFYEHDRYHRLDSTVNNNRGRLFQNRLNSAVPTVIRALSGSMRELKDAWLVLKDALVLYREAISTLNSGNLYPNDGVEDVMDVVVASILPAICEKHPRALPSGFHTLLMDFGAQVLSMHIEANDDVSATAIYERFIKSDKDAVIPHSKEFDSASTALHHLCGGNINTLARLLSAAWTIQVAHSFVCSDIMDVRNIGITSLREKLVKLYKEERDSVSGLDHPVVQYGVRFLRKNEITAYIFGPESRASLIEHSGDIICFLAATSTYTDAETDVIWRACSTSVEADFVKASFFVLGQIMGFLDFQHLIYIARRYSTTAPERLNSDAVHFLEKLFRTLEERCMPLGDGSDSLELILTSIEILKAANNILDGHPSKEPLRSLCRTEISRLSRPHVQLDKKAEVYGKCIPDIQNKSEAATTAVEVLTIFLNVRVPPSEAEYVLAMLPVSAAVDEFCDFVNSYRTRPFTPHSIFAANIRLSCIARLMTISSSSSDKDPRDRLFDFALGESALCNEARNQAWMKLHEMTSTKGTPSAASYLWQDFMQDQVPRMKAELATPKLIEFISLSLKTEFAREEVQSNLSAILEHPLWNALLRFTTTSSDGVVIDLGAKLVLDLLFDYPSSMAVSANVITQYQTQFVYIHIAGLCQDYEKLLKWSDPLILQGFYQGIQLLGLVLDKGKQSASVRTPNPNTETLELTDFEHESATIAFTAYIHGAEAPPKKVSIKSNNDAKVSDLLQKVRQKTSTTENRMILGGKEVDLLPDRTLFDAGVEQSSVVMICPKYSFELDLNKVLSCSGPIEQAVMDQYGSIEKFLDGPEHIAQSAYSFLANVRQSSQARDKVLSKSATVRDLLPPERPWRSIFSLKVLQCHLSDFAQLGVADDSFIDRTIHLLTSAILDETRPFQVLLSRELSVTLLKFLEEKSHVGEGSTPLVLDTHIVSRMIWTIFNTLALPLEPHQMHDADAGTRSPTIMSAYRALVTACRYCPPLLDVFSKDDGLVKLHESLLLGDDLALSNGICKYISGVCHDVTMSGDIADFYWKAIMPSLSNALQRGFFSQIYFNLAVDILNMDSVMQNSEAEIRHLIDTLISELWSYRHTESNSLPVTDKAMAGLIRLLGAAVTVLKSYKKPLQLHGLATQLLQQLLFPPYDAAQRTPLITSETRALAFDVFRWSFEADNDYDTALDIACDVTERSSREVGASFPGHNDWSRAPWTAAGLTNLGMTCYMNSLLQQLFFNLQFRKFIFEQVVHEVPKQDTLAQVQTLFANMQDSVNTVANTTNLAQSLNVQVGNQEDVHTFYTTLLSRLEDDLPNSSSKQALNSFFTGKSITQVKGECGHVSSRLEAFTELSVTVKNKGSLVDSLNEFVQGEPLEGANKYMCMTCEARDGGRLVNAMRRTCLEDVPDNLTFCLKRFTYESMIESENKVNDRFEFPSSIDMAFYKRSYLEDANCPPEPDEFELVGVIVHQGSLQYGHYWSYTRVPGAYTADAAMWMCLEDNRTFRCTGGIREVQEQCFGGPRVLHGLDRSDNAYVLFYQRKSYITSVTSIDIVSTQAQLQYGNLPKVNIPDALASSIIQDNKWRQHIDFLFSPQFGSFLIWFLDRSRAVLEDRNEELDDQEENYDTTNLRRLTKGDIETRLGNLIASYTTRILLADPNAEKRLESFMTALVTLVEAHPATAAHTLTNFGVDKFGFANAVRHESDKVRSCLFDGVWKCMSRLREHDPQWYSEVVHSVVSSHALVIGPELDASFGKWDEYLKFALRFSHLGLEETGFILDRGYLNWALEIIQMKWDPEVRKVHQPLNNWMRTNELDLSTLFDFIFHLLNRYVDLSEDFSDLPNSADSRSRTRSGWHLRTEEFTLLFKDKVVANTHKVWILLSCATRYCTTTARWQDYAPGKLLGLLVSDKVHASIVHLAENYLGQYCDYEESNLHPLLMLVLHYCLHQPDFCLNLMKSFSKSLLLWEGSEKEVIWFYNQAYDIVPTTVVELMPTWVNNYFQRNKAQIRQETQRFIQDKIFNLEALSDDAGFDAIRVRATRGIVKQLMTVVNGAHNRQASRGRFEPMIGTLQQASAYFSELQSAIEQQRANGVRLGQKLVVESDEAKATMVGLTQLLHDISDWEVETSLPTRTIDIRRSVEEETEASEGSDGDLDDMSSEPEVI